MTKARSMYDIDDLVYLMARLRDPKGGCPWDLEQTFESIVPHTLEEVYEVIDTIERADWTHFREELGDLLFQVIFYARMAEERGDFDFRAVVDELTAKLVRRHPHVFPDGRLADRTDNSRLDRNDVARSWESIKSEEKASRGQAGALDDVPVALPAVQRAGKLQKRAARVGFDWDRTEPVWHMLEGEMTELREAERLNDADALEEELGDVLFSVVNLARHLHIDPERALRRTNRKFEQRFAYIEEALRERGERVQDVTLDTLEYYWVEAKNHFREQAELPGIGPADRR